MKSRPEIRFYSRKHACVPKRYGFYCIETVRISSFYKGEEYISRHERTGWLVSDPNKRFRFKDRKMMDEWIDAKVASS
jgi:hypothetical protein